MKTGRYIFSITAALAVCRSVHAFLGVGDVVIVAADPAHELLWSSEELPQWISMIQKAETQVQQAKEMITIAGHPKDFAEQIVGDAKPALNVALDANTLQASTEVVDFAKSSWSLYKSVPKSLKGNLEVSDTFKILGETISRDRSLYTGMAGEKALRARLEHAISKKRAVDTQELTYQQHALTALSGASTQSEVALHQAGLAASQQRMAVAAARVDQAQGELNDYIGEQQLEEHKQQQMQSEEAKKFVETALVQATNAAGAPVERFN